MATCYVISVGHGNSAVVAGDEGTVIIDAGPGNALIEFLRIHQITTIDHLLLSHADSDHIRGAMALLAYARKGEGFWIRNIHVNPDGRDTRIWNDFVHDAHDLHKSAHLRLFPTVGVGHPNRVDLGGAVVEVVAPDVAQMLHGVGGRVSSSERAYRQTANGMSAVVTVTDSSGHVILFPGDLDADALSTIVDSAVNLSCSLIVFPHHGGLPGGHDASAFTNSLLDKAAPNYIVFSNGDGRSAIPSAEVVRECLRHACGACVYALASSPALEHCLSELSSHSHVNGSGTLRVRLGSESFGVEAV